MLVGEHVVLRARRESDVAVLHEELYDDVPTRIRADTRGWMPVGLADSPYAAHGARVEAAEFSIVERSTDELAGEAILWQIDPHNRSAHAGLALRPRFRGRGLAVDTLRVLVDYALRIRGLHRVQLEIVADNEPMLSAAQRVGFVQDGVLRESVWVGGRFADQIVLSVLARVESSSG
ncbi:acetyltransferase [Flexivirga endophytica]|uniref:Acetyltransferase n=1 Tax=Flexivirga endophytica TaxID=1849103 RepID=A0A916SZ82_9MICO|nr:GNAT family protein [Flexivirga endophytica]GGB23967.1 acetyltransferase [Flexivirga endophytica]GHB57910.1 acetyltransferase [Flexivirga endophytica]